MELDRSNVILQGVVGSQSYGLANEGSDIDRLGIYVAPIDYVLGLNGYGEVVDGPEKPADSLVTHDPDVTLHEVGKFVRLALRANPTILELLYLPDYDDFGQSGQLLVAYRESFLSAPEVRARYGGYVKAQADRLLNRAENGQPGFSSDVKSRTAKHGRHCFRLLLQGMELLSDGRLTVNVSSRKNFLFEMGEFAAKDPEAFHANVMAEIAKLDDIISPLPDKPNRDLVNSMLVAIRLYEGQQFIGESMPYVEMEEVS